MSNDELQKLLPAFRTEAETRLRVMASGLLALKKTPSDSWQTEQTEIIETILQGTRDLKAGARMAGLTQVEAVCHSLESVFAALRGRRLAISPELLDLLHRIIDALGGLLAAGAQQPPVMTLIRRLDDTLRKPPPEPGRAAAAAIIPLVSPVKIPAGPRTHRVARPPVVPAGAAPGMIRVSAAKLDALMRQVEELRSPRLAASQRASELSKTAATLDVWKRQRLQLLRIRPALRLVKRDAGQRANDGNTRKPALSRPLACPGGRQFHMEMLKAKDPPARLQRPTAQEWHTLAAKTGGLPPATVNFRGVLVRAGGQIFIVPASSIERVTRTARNEARPKEDRQTILLDGQTVSLVWLSDVLELPRQLATDEPANRTPVVVLGSPAARAAFRVEEILGELEVPVKAPGRRLARLGNVASASTPGTSRVAPVLNVADLLKSVLKSAAMPLASVSWLSTRKSAKIATTHPRPPSP